ncbi:MAG: hypothetical protein IKT42_02495 [Clostridia bacterium]|nr:hypothetical protein [Clostridia bacterium]
MKYPMINRRPRREVNVPELSGGLNLRDSLTGIRDNQMTDGINMWYKDGVLRTRPSFVTNEDMIHISSRVYEDVYIVDIKSHPDIKNGDAVLVSCIDCDGTFKEGAWLTNLKFFWQYPDKTVVAGAVDFDGMREESCKTKEELEIQAAKSSRLVFAKDGYIYLFVNEKGSSFSTYKAKIEKKLKWEYINADEYYIPTVFAHCKAKNNGLDYSGTMFEGYNLLTDSYKMIYSSINLEDVVDGQTLMRYPYINKLQDGIDTKIVARLTNKEGKVCEHTAIWTGGKDLRCFENVDATPQDGMYLYVTAYHVHFVTENGTSKISTVNKDDYIEDNLEITVIPLKNKSGDMMKKVFGMSRGIWFGGSANGISNGSRLFLCGNKDDGEKSLLVWSSLNNPLYFPENNYAYVGDKTQGVTTFGRQGENLIIFKEKSTYYTYYATNNSIVAGDLINQSVVDYEASQVYFPIVQLNANVGCDCPGSVQLCRNRLVWANSDGNVYTLYSNNQYSERTIYKVSDMIYSALAKENDLRNAVSCDFEGHYLLGIENKIYVMDYNSYGYQYASSYSKNEDSNVMIPWYIWTCEDNATFYEINNRFMSVSKFMTDSGVAVVFSPLMLGSNGYDKLAVFDEKSNKIKLVNKAITSRLQTKLFDFSSSGYLKNIDRVSVGFGNNGGAPISLSFVTDKGSESENISLVSDNTDERDAGFITVKNFYPGIRAVRNFGVKIECDGPLFVDGMSLQYRTLGGVK